MQSDKLSLTTIDQLSSLVERDDIEHVLKQVAQLFLDAANDWPTNQILISDFVKELNEYFGTPLTKEKISNKKLDSSSGNTWCHEAGSSVIEMLDVSKKNYGHQNLDETLQKLYSYYESQLKNIDTNS